MAPKKVANRLKALDVGRLPVGLHLDGLGLFLQVTAGGRSWFYRYTSPTMVYGPDSTRAGKPMIRDMGLGSTHTVSLAKARDLAKDARELVNDGIDPIEDRAAKKKRAQLQAAKSVTFKQAAESYITAHKSVWDNDKSEAQWKSSLTNYAYPLLGNLPVADIDLSLVRKVLEPIWHKKNETARRVRGRIEAILDRETGLGNRVGDNPADRKLVTQTLGRQAASKGHFAALPYVDIATFMEALRAEDGLGARALELAILCANRTAEVIGAQWSEIDFQQKQWQIPAERMKARKAHTVPLSDRAVTVLREMAKLRTDDKPTAFVFPGSKKGKHLSNMALLATLKRMKRGDLTAHGFRSTFTDWARDLTNFAREVREAALAHTLDSDVEAAYARGEMLRKRRQLMDAWAKYCDAPKADRGVKVVPIGGR